MALEIDRYAHVESSLQRWDPRFKLISLFLLIFVLASLRTLPLTVLGAALSIGLLLLSRIPLGFVFAGLKWVILFLLPFFIILPVTYPGTEAYWLGIPFAPEGLRLATLIVVKSFSIIVVALVLFGTRRFDVSMVALHRLRCPSLIVQMMLFTYRYIFLFMDEMKRLDTAMKARGFVKKPNIYTLKVMGGFIGTLLIRSFERTERIYKAMLSKGYQGELPTMVEFQSNRRDFIKAGLVLTCAILLLCGDWLAGFQIAERAWY